MAQHVSIYTLLDYSGEKSAVRLYNGAVTAVSIGGFLTAFGDLRDAIGDITLGTIHQEQWVGDLTLLSNDLPTNPFAQRELKWLVRYHGDTSNKRFTMEIPTADPTGRLIPGTDLADLTQTEVAAFVTAFEAQARTPDSDTETVTVDEIVLVGRNL
jgi:hypothetical protein